MPGPASFTAAAKHSCRTGAYCPKGQSGERLGPRASASDVPESPRRRERRGRGQGPGFVRTAVKQAWQLGPGARPLDARRGRVGGRAARPSAADARLRAQPPSPPPHAATTRDAGEGGLAPPRPPDPRGAGSVGSVLQDLSPAFYFSKSVCRARPVGPCERLAEQTPPFWGREGERPLPQ